MKRVDLAPFEWWKIELTLAAGCISMLCNLHMTGASQPLDWDHLILSMWSVKCLPNPRSETGGLLCNSWGPAGSTRNSSLKMAVRGWWIKNQIELILWPKCHLGAKTQNYLLNELRSLCWCPMSRFVPPPVTNRFQTLLVMLPRILDSGASWFNLWSIKWNHNSMRREANEAQ